MKRSASHGDDAFKVPFGCEDALSRRHIFQALTMWLKRFFLELLCEGANDKSSRFYQFYCQKDNYCFHFVYFCII